MHAFQSQDLPEWLVQLFYWTSYISFFLGAFFLYSWLTTSKEIYARRDEREKCHFFFLVGVAFFFMAWIG